MATKARSNGSDTRSFPAMITGHGMPWASGGPGSVSAQRSSLSLPSTPENLDHLGAIDQHHAFFQRRFDLFRIGRDELAGKPGHDGHARAQPHQGPRQVEGGVAVADHRHILLELPDLTAIQPDQKCQAAFHTVQVFPGDPQLAIGPGADGDDNGGEILGADAPGPFPGRRGGKSGTGRPVP